MLHLVEGRGTRGDRRRCKKEFVAGSTVKVSSPINLYGATKLTAFAGVLTADEGNDNIVATHFPIESQTDGMQIARERPGLEGLRRAKKATDSRAADCFEWASHTSGADDDHAGRANAVASATYFALNDQNPMQIRAQIGNACTAIRLLT